MDFRNIKYRFKLIGYLALVLTFLHGKLLATSEQSIISLASQSLGLGLGDAAPRLAYNSNANEYLLIYSDFGASCDPGDERLFGIIVNALTGNLVGNAIPISNCNNSIRDQSVIFNPVLNEYFIFYKSIGDIGNKSNLYYCTINGTTKDIGFAPTKLVGDVIADPYQDFSLSYDTQSGIYALGYHKKNAQSETSLKINYIDGNSKSIKAYETLIDKNTFVISNKGVHGSKLVFNGSSFISVFELKLDGGSEIWGGFINPSSGTIINDYFRISPVAASDNFYSNPDAAYGAQANELIIAYEESYFAESNGVYVLSDNIRVQKVNASTGALINPSNVAISPLSGSGNTEDKKFPSIAISATSNEIILTYYGIRFAAGTDQYNLELHRINYDDLTSINTTSIEVAASIGKQVLENSLLKQLSIAFNSNNNQYNLVWINESNQEVKTQIWRYNNNAPGAPTISANTFNEELPIGYTVAILSASDPDPEDSSPVFSLISGTGGEDNSYFQIVGNELKIAKRLSFEDASSRNVKIRATDSHGGFNENLFSITIIDIDEQPYGLALTGSLSVEENSSLTSGLSVSDEDVGNTHSYSLVVGDSSDNNSNFNIALGANILELTGNLNYEDTSRQYIRIRATDNTGLSCEKAFTIVVTDINEEPEQIVLSTNSLPENDLETTAIVDVIDPDNYSNYSYSKSSGEGDDDNAFFNLVDNELKPVTPLNFEVKNSYKIRLRAFDGTYDKTESFTISVSDLNDVPDSVRLSESKFLADQPNGTLVGYLITYDQDAEDTHTYSLIDGTEFFFINGTEIRALNSFSYDFSIPENNLYNLTVRATDSQGGSQTENLTVEVVLFIDDENPEIRNFNDIEKYIDSKADSLIMSVDIRDNEQLGSVNFYYRAIRSSDDFIDGTELLKTTIFDSKNYSVVAAISAMEMDDMGIEYFFKAADASGNIDSTEIGYTYWSFSPKDFNAVNSKSFNGTAASYKIISNPYLLESNKVSKLFADFGSSSDDTWRLFSYDGDENIEIGNINGSSIYQGNGYWFNKTEKLNQKILLETARIQENNRQNPFVINLKKGWNLVGNPYPFRLDWEHVNSLNDLFNELDLYIFNKSYSETKFLEEFQGGFVFTDQDLALEIPVSSPNSSGSRIAKSEDFKNGWLVNLTLDNGHTKNSLGGVGMHELASWSYDHFDCPLLPRLINHLDISFSHPEHFAKEFTRDIVEIQENYIWEFVASSDNKNSYATLTWDLDLFKNNTNQLIIYDVLRDKILDVREKSEYEFIMNQPSTFKVVYGNPSFVEESLGKIKIAALKPYPNPFSNQVSIPVNLPFSNQDYNIECRIFNLMGERVFEQKMDGIDHGLFHIEWSGPKNAKLEQGIYIYSIKVKNGFQTNSFHGRIVKN